MGDEQMIIYSNDLVSSDIIVQTDDDGNKRNIIIDWIAEADLDNLDVVVVEGYYEDNGDEFATHYTGNEMLNVLRR